MYLSDPNNIDYVLELTDLSLDELEHIVGRFAKHSRRSGLLRGEVIVSHDAIVIRHHFTKKILWTNKD